MFEYPERGKPGDQRPGHFCPASDRRRDRRGPAPRNDPRAKRDREGKQRVEAASAEIGFEVGEVCGEHFIAEVRLAEIEIELGR